MTATLRYLLDTNIVSQPVCKRPDVRVLAELREFGEVCAIASTTWHELHYGASLLPESRRRAKIEHYIRGLPAVMPILDYDAPVAAWHGRIRAKLQASGLTTPILDGQIAAVAHVHSLTVITANVVDFEPFGVPVKNWMKPE